MFQPYPIGHDSRPAPALIFAVYLWAIFLCPDVSIKVNETAYFDRAVQEAATALLSKHPHKTMHSLQAEVLLANYFFARGRFVEGKHHLAFAVSTALSAGLHRIRSANWMINPNLPTPRDSVEEGELILGWWTVFNLDKAWAAGLICSPNFEHSDHPMATQIDTPWPLEMEDYEQVRDRPTATVLLPSLYICRGTSHRMHGLPTLSTLSCKESKHMTLAFQLGPSRPRPSFSGIA